MKKKKKKKKIKYRLVKGQWLVPWCTYPRNKTLVHQQAQATVHFLADANPLKLFALIPQTINQPLHNKYVIIL